MINSKKSLKQLASSVLEADTSMRPEKVPGRRSPFVRKWSPFVFLTVLVIFLVVFASQFVNALLQMTSPTAQVPQELSTILEGRDGSFLAPFNLPAGRTVLYEQNGNIYSTTTEEPPSVNQDEMATAQATPDVVPQPFLLNTPGYIYNRGVSPLVTPTRQLIYTGTGLWINDLAHNQARSLVSIGDDQVVTSLVLSRDGSQLAWSVAPKDGQGMIQIFAGPINATKLVYEQSATHCPCFRVFSFWPASNATGHDTLLLTDDQGDTGPVQHGLWIFPIHSGASSQPTLILQNDPPQGPLAISPYDATLLYTTYEGSVAVPGNLPADLASVEYANSLMVGTLQNNSPYLNDNHVVLAEQNVQENNEQYHWLMQPSFSPDGQTVVYVQFSADSQGSFSRTNALYIIRMRGTVAPTQPTLIATTGANYVEFGSWWDAHTVTVFMDNELYALDVQRGMLAKITATPGYAHEIAVLN